MLLHSLSLDEYNTACYNIVYKPKQSNVKKKINEQSLVFQTTCIYLTIELIRWTVKWMNERERERERERETLNTKKLHQIISDIKNSPYTKISPSEAWVLLLVYG